jgi:DNA-binding XRE family transcriptional regulator
MSVESPNKTAHLWVFYCRNKKKDKQKRLPWQEAVFNVVDKLGRLSPTGRRFGPTQKELAERTGIAQTEISKLENGTRNPSIKLMQRLADGMDMVLNISITPKASVKK